MNLTGKLNSAMMRLLIICLAVSLSTVCYSQKFVEYNINLVQVSSWMQSTREWKPSGWIKSKRNFPIKVYSRFMVVQNDLNSVYKFTELGEENKQRNLTQYMWQAKSDEDCYSSTNLLPDVIVRMISEHFSLAHP